MPYAPYSPYLVPSVYHLFRLVEHLLREQHFVKCYIFKKHLKLFFVSKSASFFSDGIRKLPIKWQKVIDNNGNKLDE